LARIKRNYASEYDDFSSAAPQRFSVNNEMFAAVDAEVLYCMIRMFCPDRIVEVGCGYSTKLCAMAIEENRRKDATYACELTSYDPYPPE
jgi:predicted O-methyltransferase YrrM